MVFPSGLDGFAGYPVRHDIVDGLRVGRDLDELDGSPAPSAMRDHPGTGTGIVACPEILVVREVFVPLDQAETARIVECKTGHQEMLGINEGAPEPLAVSVRHLESIRVVNGRTPFADGPGSSGAVKKHAGQGGDTQHPGRGPEKEPDPHPDPGHHSRADDKPVGTGDTGSVEQGIDHDRVAVPGGAHQPEFPERRKLLMGREGGIDGNAPGGEAEVVRLPNATEIAGTGKDQELVVPVVSHERISQLETGKTESPWDPRAEGRRGIGEIGNMKPEPRDPAVREDEEMDGGGVVLARGHELHLEARMPAVPQAPGRPEPDGLVLVVAESLEEVGDLAGWGIGFGRQTPGLPDDQGKKPASLGLCGGGCDPRERETGHPQECGGPLQQENPPRPGDSPGEAVRVVPVLVHRHLIRPQPSVKVHLDSTTVPRICSRPLSFKPQDWGLCEA